MTHRRIHGSQNRLRRTMRQQGSEMPTKQGHGDLHDINNRKPKPKEKQRNQSTGFRDFAQTISCISQDDTWSTIFVVQGMYFGWWSVSWPLRGKADSCLWNLRRWQCGVWCLGCWHVPTLPHQKISTNLFWLCEPSSGAIQWEAGHFFLGLSETGIQTCCWTVPGLCGARPNLMEGITLPYEKWVRTDKIDFDVD